MSIFKDASPTLDGGSVNIGDGNVKQRHLRIPVGEFSTPFFIRPDGDNGRLREVTSLPWSGSIVAGQIEILSSVSPGMPTNVSMSTGDGYVQVSWNDVQGNETGYDVHVSTVSGFTPSSSTLEEQVGPDVTQSSQISKSNGTTYYAKVVAKNSSSTDVSAEVSGTPQAAGGASPVFSDGFESGDLSFTENGYSWDGAVQGAVTNSTPRNGSYALDITFAAVADGGDDQAQADMTLGAQLTEIWVEYYLRVPDNYCHREQSGSTNNKFFQVYGGPRSDPDAGVHAELELGAANCSSEAMHWTYQNPDDLSPNPGEVENIQADAILESERGTWQQWRWHVKVYSDSVVATDTDFDGVFEIWKDGALLFSQSDLPIGNPDSSLNYMDHIRILGWSNSGYDAETVFTVDDVKIYESDPGW